MTSLKHWLSDLVWRLRGLGTWRDLREADISTVISFMAEAEQQHFSGVGRPDWLSKNKHKVDRVIVHSMLVETSPRDCFRSQVLFLLRGGEPMWFPIDILPSRYFSLKRLTSREARRLACDLMMRAAIVPLDKDQAEGWTRSGWRQPPQSSSSGSD